MEQPLRRIAAACAAATLLWAALFPYRLTDGDSCLYAALARDMADDGAAAWLAPRWAEAGAPACFHEHPPGAFWPAAALQLAGVPARQAPLVANALALLALAGSVWWLASGAAGLGALAAGLLLLHLQVLHYAVRFGLELPFAACCAAALAAARSRARSAPLWLGLAFGGALLTRGVFAFALPPVALLSAAARPGEPGCGARLRPVLAGLALGVALAAAFDLGHRAAAGHGFWSAYLHKQVLPSLEEGGTVHGNRGSTTIYYLGRLLYYGLPWLPLAALLGLARARRHGTVPAAGGAGNAGRASRAGADARSALVAAAWILLLLAGAIAARRQGSRYLFACWPASAWLAALALRPWWQARSPHARARLGALALALPLLATAGKSLLAPRGAWWRAAEALEAARPRLAAAGAAVYGPFAPHDDRLKQFLRYHAGMWAFRAPPQGAPAGGLLCLEPGAPAPAGAETLLETELFRLVRPAPVPAAAPTPQRPPPAPR